VDAKRLADPLSPEFRLEAWPFFHMNLAIRAYDTEMKRLLKPAGIDMPRWRILMIAHEQEPVSVGEVAGRAIMEMSTVTRAMQRLQVGGFLEMSTRPTDQRVTEARLTAEGRAAVERVLRAASRAFHQAFDGFSPEEVTSLNGLLARVYRGLREPI
jgi:DNA-binding MarR family transcriptional regulator